MENVFKVNETLKEISLDFIVSTISGDGLAPLGNRSSAGTVMTKFAGHDIRNH